MNLRDVPPELVDKLIRTYEDIVIVNTDLSEMVAREILAAVLPEYEKQVRAKLAEAIADVPEARDDEDPEYVEAYWDGRDDGARIARGEL